MGFVKETEQDSNYRHLEEMNSLELLTHINAEDLTVAEVVKGAIPEIDALVKAIVSKLRGGGRVFYIGAGTSGRLGVLDASETVPTFGVDPGLFTAIIAGGDKALRTAVEFAEDDNEQAWLDLRDHAVSDQDVVVGISASGTAPYVLSALSKCREAGIITGCITCNKLSPVADLSDFPVEVVTGPEFLTGSTRMKAGTAQKLVLNMISTTVMILLGRVSDNKMVNMQLSNNKLIQRAVTMVMKFTGITDENEAKQLLELHGSVAEAIERYRS